MDKDEFQRLLNMFPVVRSRDYNAEAESSSLSASLSAKDALKQSENACGEGDKKETETEDDFWGELISTSESKVNAEKMQRFCDALRKVHYRLDYEELSVEAAQNLLSSS